MKRHHVAFTVIELLVVIAIIAAALALIIPTALTVRRQSQLTVCQAQLRELSQLVFAHTVSARGRLPGSPDLDDSIPWTDILTHSTLKMPLCPLVTEFATATPNSHMLAPGEGSAFVGWTGDYPMPGLQPGMRGTFGWNLDLASQRLAALRQTSRIPMFADASRPGVLPVPPELQATFPTPGYSAEERVYLLHQGLYIVRHSSRINVSFVDGHCESVDLDDLLKLKWWPTLDSAGR